MLKQYKIITVMKYFSKTFKWHFPKPQILNCHGIGKSPCENPNHEKTTKAQRTTCAGDEQEVEASSQLPAPRRAPGFPGKEALQPTEMHGTGLEEDDAAALGQCKGGTREGQHASGLPGWLQRAVQDSLAQASLRGSATAPHSSPASPLRPPLLLLS